MENSSRGIGIKAAQQLQREENAKAECAGMMSDGPCRMNAHAVLIDRAARLEREAAGLRRLAGALPADLESLDPVAAEALWRLVVDSRR